ncbi:uroporphyrinogen decarboxylase [Candidatus Pelagibacter sp.]|nr:uroporphyrinogen decarboxylase [Candidatus Pelagibacter sp.]
MTVLLDCINKKINTNCIWLMRQAGRYLPEFRKIRSVNQDFIKLCLNANLSSEITIQPLKRFDIDAAIIFSDILLVPHSLGQTVNFKKDFGPQLDEIDFNKVSSIDETYFVDKLKPVYNAIKKTKDKEELKDKDLIGFVGAPWTILVYMLNQKSPKKENLNHKFKDKKLVEDLLKILVKFLKIHIENQINSGATIIQIFDSWAGLLDKKDYENYIYKPTKDLVDFVKSKKTPAICFPKGIKDYKSYVSIVNPDVISIDYDVDPIEISKTINITVQGGLNPNFLIGSKEELQKNVKKYLDIFRDKPYIFNLGHGVLPDTDPSMVDYLVKLVKNY